MVTDKLINERLLVVESIIKNIEVRIQNIETNLRRIDEKLVAIDGTQIEIFKRLRVFETDGSVGVKYINKEVEEMKETIKTVSDFTQQLRGERAFKDWLPTVILLIFTLANAFLTYHTLSHVK